MSRQAASKARIHRMVQNVIEQDGEKSIKYREQTGKEDIKNKKTSEAASFSKKRKRGRVNNTQEVTNNNNVTLENIQNHNVEEESYETQQINAEKVSNNEDVTSEILQNSIVEKECSKTMKNNAEEVTNDKDVISETAQNITVEEGTYEIQKNVKKVTIYKDLTLKKTQNSTVEEISYETKKNYAEEVPNDMDVISDVTSDIIQNNMAQEESYKTMMNNNKKLTYNKDVTSEIIQNRTVEEQTYEIQKNMTSEITQKSTVEEISYETKTNNAKEVPSDKDVTPEIIENSTVEEKIYNIQKNNTEEVTKNNDVIWDIVHIGDSTTEEKSYENQKNNAAEDTHNKDGVAEEITQEQNISNNNGYCIDDVMSDSIPPSETLSDIFDFDDGSSDNYIPNSSELSDESVPQNKRRKNKTRPVKKVIFSESSSESDVPSTNQKEKKRKSLKERREDRLNRILKRNAGLSYTTKSGKTVKSRSFNALTPCRAKCKELIPEDARQYIFGEYWGLGSYDERAKYLERLICTKKKMSSKLGSKRQREYANKYKLIHFDNEYNICKGCFLKTLGESGRFLQTINKKIQKFGRVTKTERGRAASYKKVSDSRLNQVREHIEKFPAYESHYSRAKTSKKYLSSDLSIEKMYKLYEVEVDNPVSLTVYRSVFKMTNLSFKKPAVDTCNKCNLLQNKLKHVQSLEEKRKIQDDLKQHQEQYETAYNEKRKDKKIAQESDDTCVIAFDLQQCLPTPLLTTSSVFYKRQLWVYNLTLHDFKTNHAYCYMWPESNGGRGANQIASCLYDFAVYRLPLLHPNVSKLIMYSDSCGGQNKNSVVTTISLILMQNSSHLTTIEHKFLVPGHTHMEVDSDHALIERAKKRTSMNIHLPRDWYQLVRSASNRANKFSVIEMTYDNFYDFADFSKKQLQVKKVNCKGEKFVWSNVQILKYIKNQFPTFSYKESYGTSDYTSMSYAKRNKRYEHNIDFESIKKCYVGQVAIAAEKKKDLISLLDYIDPSVHEFYINLQSTADVSPNLDPDLIDEEEFYATRF